MNTAQPYRWANTKRLPDGHRIFRAKVSDPDIPTHGEDPIAWALADNSGDTPEQTDDGVLWLDFTRPLRIARQGSTGEYQQEYFVIPLRTPDGLLTRTSTDATTLLYLASKFNWEIWDAHHDKHYWIVQP